MIDLKSFENLDAYLFVLDIHIRTVEISIVCLNIVNLKRTNRKISIVALKYSFPYILYI